MSVTFLHILWINRHDPIFCLCSSCNFRNIKKHCFPQRIGLLFVFVCLFVFINHAKSYPYLMPFSCCLFLVFLVLSAAFSRVLNVTLREQELFKRLLCWCSIQGLVAVVCFPWALLLDCTFLRNTCPEEGQLSFPLTGRIWGTHRSSQDVKRKPRSQFRPFNHVLLSAA